MNSFPGFTNNETKIVVLLVAYPKAQNDYAYLQALAEDLDMNSYKISRVLQSMYYDRKVVKDYTYDQSYEICHKLGNKSLIYPLLFWTLENHPEYLELGPRRLNEPKDLGPEAKLALQIYNDKVPEGDLPKEICDKLIAYGILDVNGEYIGRIINKVDQPTAESLWDHVFGRNLEYLVRTHGNDWELFADSMSGTDLLALYDYLFNGNIAEKVQEKTYAGDTLLGLLALRESNYDLASTLFSRALRKKSKELKVKGVYPHRMLAYFQGMALVKSQDTSKEDVKKFADKLMKAFGYDDPLGHFFDIHAKVQRVISRAEMYYLDRSDGTPIQTLIRFIAFRHFSDKKATLPNLPGLGIMLNEVAPLVDIDPHRIENLTAIFGPSLMGAVVKREPWEDVLDAIREQCIPKQGVAPGVTNTPVDRVLFVITGNTLSLALQTWLKSGRWGKPRPLSPGSGRAQDYIAAAPQNAASLASHAYGYYSSHFAEDLPLMVGLDNLYYTDHNFSFLTPVTVEELPLTLRLVKDKNTDTFTLQPSIQGMSKKGYTSPIYYREDKKQGIIQFINPSDSQRKFLEMLGMIERYPLSQAAKIMTVVTQAARDLNMGIEGMDTAVKVTRVKGEAKLSLRVTPTAGGYMVYPMCKPCDIASDRFVPGAGAYSYNTIDSDSRALEVTRNLDAEVEVFEQLADYLQKILKETPIAGQKLSLGLEQMIDLVDWVHDKGETYTVEWPEGKSFSILSTPESGKWNISLSQQGGWFELEGEVKIDESTVLSASKLLELVGQAHGRFLQLGPDKFLKLSASLRRQLSRLEGLSSKEHNHVGISPMAAASLDLNLGDGIYIEADKALTDLRNRIANASRTEYTVPKQLKARLRDYQVDGYTWLKRLTEWGAGACLADDMGLGKTVQAISYMLTTAAEGPSLVVAPASVLTNWEREIARFAPALEAIPLNLSADRQGVIDNAKPYQVILTTYGLLPSAGEMITSRKWTTAILDEAHVIKNRTTKTSQVAMKIDATNRMILTGTPVQNSLSELWNLMRFINPGLLGSYEQFNKKFIIPIQVNHDKERQRQLNRLIAPFLLRRTKEEVVDELPDKEEITISVEMSAQEMGVYESLRRNAQEALKDIDRVDVNTLAELTRLRLAACDTRLVADSVKYEPSKINALLDLTSSIVDGGNKMLVFSQFTSFLSLVKEAYDRAGIQYIYLDGSTPQRQRQKIVDNFQHGDTPVFLVSLKAGGLGLNLTGANYVVHLDPWWNPAIEQQATDRAYRIGQKRKVTVYHLIAAGTVEEKIKRLHATKRNLADALLEGADVNAQLTPAEILELLSNG